MATISDFPISECLKLSTAFKFRVKNTWIFLSYFKSVHKGYLELLEDDDIGKKLKILQAFLSQDGHHLRFTNFGGQVHLLKTIHNL